MATDPSSNRWSALAGDRSGPAYARRFADLAARGLDVHGEARFCARLVTAPARVLDAGCGTGRVAIALAQWGYDTVGIDADASMLEQARLAAPDQRWVLADLADWAGESTSYDLVVLAGNVVPLLGPGALATALATLSGVLAPEGVLVTGFGLDRNHLPAGCPVTTLAEHDELAGAAGLQLLRRCTSWDSQGDDGTDAADAAGYAVSVLGWG